MVIFNLTTRKSRERDDSEENVYIQRSSGQILEIIPNGANSETRNLTQSRTYHGAFPQCFSIVLRPNYTQDRNLL